MQVTSHPLLWAALKGASRAAVVQVQAALNRPALSYLWDHRVQGRAILPGAAMFEMAVAAGKVSPSYMAPPAMTALYLSVKCTNGRI